MKSFHIFNLLFLVTSVVSCGSQSTAKEDGTATVKDTEQTSAGQNIIIPAADQIEEYLPLLKGKKIGLMGNQTSVVGKEHLVDVLLRNDIDIQFAFAPEHGFRGDIDRFYDRVSLIIFAI